MAKVLASIARALPKLGFVPNLCEGVAAAVAWEVDMPGHQTWRLADLHFLQRIRAAVTGV